MVQGTDDCNYLAGVVGFLDSSLIENCYNIGNIKGGNYAVEGILGNFNNSREVVNCYYLENTINGANGTSSSIDYIKDNNNMKKIGELLGNGFKDDTQNINGGYPILIWQ